MSLSNSFNENSEDSELFFFFFQKISQKELKTKNNELYSKIYTKTKKISSYFENSLKKFCLLFENNIETFEESLIYLEKISIPNKCLCASVVDNIPGWRCIDCSKFENTLYCSNCYIRKNRRLRR